MKGGLGSPLQPGSAPAPPAPHPPPGPELTLVLVLLAQLTQSTTPAAPWAALSPQAVAPVPPPEKGQKISAGPSLASHSRLLCHYRLGQVLHTPLGLL